MSDNSTNIGNEPSGDGADLVRVIAHLPGFDIEVARWRSADAEHVAINLKAMPSFDAVARAFEVANPFTLWMRSAELVWLPWLAATRMLTTPWVSPSAAPRTGDRDS